MPRGRVPWAPSSPRSRAVPRLGSPGLHRCQGGPSAQQQALACGLTVTPLPKRSGHLMGLKFNSGVPQKLVQALKNEKIYVSVRGNSIRVAPYLYNEESDFDRLIEIIKLTH